MAIPDLRATDEVEVATSCPACGRAFDISLTRLGQGLFARKGSLWECDCHAVVEVVMHHTPEGWVPLTQMVGYWEVQHSLMTGNEVEQHAREHPVGAVVTAHRRASRAGM